MFCVFFLSFFLLSMSRMVSSRPLFSVSSITKACSYCRRWIGRWSARSPSSGIFARKFPASAAWLRHPRIIVLYWQREHHRRVKCSTTADALRGRDAPGSGGLRLRRDGDGELSRLHHGLPPGQLQQLPELGFVQGSEARQAHGNALAKYSW